MTKKGSKQKGKKKYTGVATKTLDKLWSKKIKTLAGNKCELCGSTEGLNAHHIQPRKIYNVRWNLTNGICLCEYCHTLGPYSAHRNPLWFYRQILSMREVSQLIIETISYDWKNHINEIKETLK